MSSPRLPAPHLALQVEQQLNTRGYELLDAQRAAPGATFEVSAGKWHCFETAEHGALNVLVPVAVQVSVDAGGRVTALDGGPPTASDLASAKVALDDVIAAGRLDDPARRTRAKHASHEVFTRPDGQRAVRRRAFDTGPGIADAARK